MQIETLISNALTGLLNNLGANEAVISYYKLALLIALIVVIGSILHFTLRRVLIKAIILFAKKSKSNFDNRLVEYNFFYRLSFILPLAALYLFDGIIFADFPQLKPIFEGVFNIVLLVIIVGSFDALLNATRVHLEHSKFFKNKPINSYVQLVKTLIYLFSIIILISILIGKSPLYLLTALGAVSAIILLIFRDTILGFTASIQISANDMVRVGDWVSLPKYGADGDVTEINLVTVKIKNWDNTISTVPTYAFINDSFKNWRGMSESGGRRIKRYLSFNMQTVKFADDEFLKKLSKIQILTNFIEQSQLRINKFNGEQNADKSELANGRHMTNIGLFRNYAELYLKSNPLLNVEMTTMVRQLQPTELGIPLEIYCFSKNQEWIAYEQLSSDLFDHLIAVSTKFDLKIFQSPTGDDFKLLNR